MPKKDTSRYQRRCELVAHLAKEIRKYQEAHPSDGTFLYPGPKSVYVTVLWDLLESLGLGPVDLS